MSDIPQHLQWIVSSMGVTQRSDESDEQFVRRLYGLQQHAELLRTAKRYGAHIEHAANSQTLRQAINDRLFELLEEAGVIPGKVVRLRDKQILIEEIYETDMRPREVRVKYWRVDWDRSDNRGRFGNEEAGYLLQRVG